MSFGHYNFQPPSNLPPSKPHHSTASPPSPLSRRRISACINELIVLYHSIPTLPTPRRTILSELAVRTLLARNLSIEPNIYGWISPPDGPIGPANPPEPPIFDNFPINAMLLDGEVPQGLVDKVLGDYDHDGNPIALNAPTGTLAGPDCCHYEPKHFAIMPPCKADHAETWPHGDPSIHFHHIPEPPSAAAYKQSVLDAVAKMWGETFNTISNGALPQPPIWNHPPSTPPIANINPNAPNECKQETINKLLSDFAKNVKNPPPQPPTKPPQSTHTPTGVAAFNLSLSITPQGQQFLKNLLKSIIEKME